jgi:hypothetical protein
VVGGGLGVETWAVVLAMAIAMVAVIATVLVGGWRLNAEVRARRPREVDGSV